MAIKILLSLSLVLCFLQLSLSSDPQSPQIYVGGYIGSEDSPNAKKVSEIIKTSVSYDLDQDAPITLVNGSTYILTVEVQLIAFMCKASYPVEWTFPNSKWFLLHENTFGIYVVTNRRQSQDIQDRKTFTYYSQIFLYGDSRMYNGQFTCKGDKDNQGSSSITLFWEGGPFDSIFPLTRQNLSVFINTGDDSVTFPCYVNNPFVPVVLKREDVTIRENTNTTNDTWTTISHPRLEYKPEVGFIFHGTRAGGDYLDAGNYKCVPETINGNGTDSNLWDEDAVYMSFSMEPEHFVEIDEPIRTNASFNESRKSYRYECCSSTAQSPLLVLHSCSNPTTCEELKEAMKMQQLVFGSSLTHRSGGINHIRIKKYRSLFTKHVGSCTQSKVFGSFLDVNWVQCIGDGINVAKRFDSINYLKNDYFKDFPLDYKNPDPESLKKWILIEPYNRNNDEYQVKVKQGKNDTYIVYIGSTVGFRCFSSFYYSALGIRFSTKDTSGKVTLLPDGFRKAQEQTYGSEDVEILWHDIPLKAVVNVTITKDMVGLTCHVPMSMRADWLENTVYFEKNESLAPTILVEEGASLTERIVFTLNDTGKTLSCIVQGEPKPEVVWSKSGKDVTTILWNVTHSSNGSHILRLPKVTHDVQGTYQCTAANFKGQVVKTFVLIVEEASSSNTVGIVVITIVLVAMAIGFGILLRKFVLQKNSKAKLEEGVYPGSNFSNEVGDS